MSDEALPANIGGPEPDPEKQSDLPPPVASALKRESPGMPAPLPGKSRLVVIEQVCYFPAGEQPQSVDWRFARNLSSEDEQAYGPRSLKVGSQWAPLDCGWVFTASLLLLINKGKTGEPALEVGLWVPPPESICDVWDGCVISLCDIPLGESMRLPNPRNLRERIRVRSCGEQSRYAIALVPS